ncbi:hydantoinase/oxoprolinase family protein [Pseudodesulfovibrio thermohalotolerans]|uniref:hydantoinase/oxoprolinase family protein n=1 Tax=Pseudodesulfovibrio thermohalotolerans TaxID=2880651 RepID=UPI002441AC47|nr:hydantoinase/oxoprolinase family protein [Pseudodesulfovibrio thermohalotolerans]WFS63417.1 hydantoinase/oxoprolinase family protein [Pseudodesulfovibrio thermohalotolerans]
MLTIGVDTGGTFTDFTFVNGRKTGTYKTLSTPHNPAEAVLSGLRRILAEQIPGATLGDTPMAVVHGSTVATNAILERKGVPTALVTNEGFTDVIEIGRQNRAALYDLHYRRQPHIVPAHMRFGVPGRVTSEGDILEPWDEEAAARAVEEIKASGAESVAVCFLFSFLDPSHEKSMGETLRKLGLPVSLSHEILAEFREFERTSTTVVNAYVSPIMTRYLTALKNGLGQNGERGPGLRIMQSNGGSISADTAMRESVRTILSGPAGGAVGALSLGRAAGFDRLITFDMGGTSTDVSLMDGDLPMTMASSISGYPVKVPMIDIHTVGAGGGSIASRDPGGSLAVGPESAGAAPGPICYGRGGTSVTVTDANLYLGRIVPERFLGGAMSLDAENARLGIEDLARELGLPPTELAEGVLAVANANMERAIRVISVEKGFDPREFTLFSFGGAGGMHCAELAGLLGMTRVLIPVDPGILSATGMLLANVVKDYSRTVMRPAEEFSGGETEAAFAELERDGLDELAAEGVPPEQAVHERFLDMRYKGQSFEIVVPFGPDMIEAFQTMHEQRYGYRNEDKPVEVVNVRLRSLGRSERKPPEPGEMGGEDVPHEARLGKQKAIFQGAALDADILDRTKLKPGNRFSGPAIVTEYTSTIVVPPNVEARVDLLGNLVLDLG